ncbi:MAG TPA: hypothetical protein VIS99_10290, partial [Terrimicrobiaceae bacterium]
WRRTRDPYAVMVSEFMLQQTTVSAVIPYYERWLARFPTFESLALAAEEDVLGIWQGLGYYSRARNLRQAAIAVVESAAGEIPRSASELRRLPGVGEYTAAAVAAFAFDTVVPVIDSNVARVLVRLHNWQAPLDNAAGRAFLSSAARCLLPRVGGHLHNSALMELGALICKAHGPKCPECPIRRECAAHRPEQLPVRKARCALARVSEARAFVFEEGQLWLEASSGPRWRGMWLLPQALSTQRKADHLEVYPVTRFQVTMSVFCEPVNGRDLIGYFPEALPPMPSPHRRVVAAMLQRVHTQE